MDNGAAMEHFAAMMTFAKVVETKSFSAAAQALMDAPRLRAAS